MPAHIRLTFERYLKEVWVLGQLMDGRAVRAGSINRKLPGPYRISLRQLQTLLESMAIQGKVTIQRPGDKIEGIHAKITERGKEIVEIHQAVYDYFSTHRDAEPILRRLVKEKGLLIEDAVELANFALKVFSLSGALVPGLKRYADVKDNPYAFLVCLVPVIPKGGETRNGDEKG